MMTYSALTALVIWLLGVIVAWVQIFWWNRGHSLRFPKDHLTITMMSLLSWCVYPIYVIDWLCND